MRNFPSSSVPAPGRQHGFSLIELMIAMVIGLLLMVAVSQLFLTSKRNFSATDDSARMQENIRFASQMLTRHLRLAGYRAKATDPTTGTATTPGIFPPGTSTAGLVGTDGGGTLPDSIRIRFQGSGTGTSGARVNASTTFMTADDAGADGLVVDCRGYKVDANLVSFNQYTIATGANGSNALFCNGSEIVSDVDNMQLVYGEETDTGLSDLNYGPNYYVAAGSVTNMDNVTSVKIALLFRSPNPTSDVTISKTYNLLGTTIASFGDKRSRRAVNFTVGLRNRPVKDVSSL
jgi:type IV pilus assembly protein PilW